jgi:hypothetical protein
MLVPILLPEPQKKKPVILVMPQTTASMLNGNKVKTIEVTSEAAPARVFSNILGAQGEAPVSAGTYYPQTLVISFANNQTVQADVYFATALSRGTKLANLKPRGGFTAEAGKELLQLIAFDAEMQTNPKR